jgi:outer membrane protein, multidrug efflux system
MMLSCKRFVGAWVFIGTAFIMLAGCATVGPDYVRPATSVSPTWRTSLKGGSTSETMQPTELSSWWTTMNDPILNGIIQRALAGNLDVKEARSRIREARARRAVAKSGFFPTMDASGSATRSKSSENVGSGSMTNFYSVGFDASWEVDLFGNVRRSVEAASADLEATREDMNNTLVSLLSEAALNYVEVRVYQTRLAVAVANLAAQTESYQLTVWRNEAGLSDQLAVEQARYNLESTRSEIPNLNTGREEALNRLAVLTGEQPGALHRELQQSASIPMAPVHVAVGIPAEMLRRRPDVRQAERKLAAETARVGVATADLYPKLTLNGSIGLEALSTGNLFSAAGKVFGLAAGATAPIFHGGAIRQSIEIQSAVQEQALLRYESAVLKGLEEVENAIVAFGEEQVRRASLSRSVDAAKLAASLAEAKYTAGLSDFSDVLVAQRSLFTLQDQLVLSEGAVASDVIRLYKAVGGGWESYATDVKK